LQFIAGSPDVQGWVKRPEGSNRRYLSRTIVSSLQHMALQSFFNRIMYVLPVRYQVLVFGPHEGYTTNACLMCHEYSKRATFCNRYRSCPNPQCPTRCEYQPMVSLHRELISVSNQLVAAYSQLEYIGDDVEKIHAQLEAGTYKAPPSRPPSKKATPRRTKTKTKTIKVASPSHKRRKGSTDSVGAGQTKKAAAQATRPRQRKRGTDDDFVGDAPGIVSDSGQPRYALRKRERDTRADEVDMEEDEAPSSDRDDEFFGAEMESESEAEWDADAEAFYESDE
jgi:hypothetical protein